MKNNHNKKTMVNNINLKALWLAGGITLTLFSIGVIIFATTNAYCRGGEAICVSKRWGAYIGVLLGILAIFTGLLGDRMISQKKQKVNNPRRGYGLAAFGLILIATGIFLAIAGMNEVFSVSPYINAGMTILAVPIAIAGGIVTGFGIYNCKKLKTSGFVFRPILTSIFVIGIVAMIFLIFF